MDIKIAICDDEYQQREYIKTLVSNWSNDNQHSIKIDTFENAEHFKTAIEYYDILLLDIEMGKMNGIGLAKEIRQTNFNLVIIFITGYPDFMQEGYDVDAMHYLIKPISTERLYPLLDKAYSRVNHLAREICLTTDDENHIIPLDNIYYIESFNHYLEVNTADGKLNVKLRMYELNQMLSDDFINCHRSYIVNLKHIRKITHTDISLDSGDVIPLSRRLYKDVNIAMIKYIKEK